MVYNVSWVEAGEGDGTTMMTTMTTIKTTTMTKTNISMHIKMTTTNMSRSSRWPGLGVNEAKGGLPMDGVQLSISLAPKIQSEDRTTLDVNHDQLEQSFLV